MANPLLRRLLLTAAMAMSFHCYAEASAHSPDAPKPAPNAADRDPWEFINRPVFNFNETLDAYVLRPVASGYRKVTPEILDQGITNIFNNLGDVVVLANCVLQLKAKKSAATLSRMMFNTTFGLAGFFDVAASFGLPKEQEDFGQTMGYWGMGSGPYLVLPFLGPSTVRDGVGLVPDFFIYPTGFFMDEQTKVIAGVVYVIDKRADLIPAESFIIGDKYQFLRNAYLQRRDYLVNDGVVEDPFANDKFDDSYDF